MRMIRLFIILVGVGLGILFVPEPWRQEGRKFIEHHVDQFKAHLLKEADRFKRFTNDVPSPHPEPSPKPLDKPDLPSQKEEEADWDEILEVQEKVSHALKLLEVDDDR